jgi:guanyl-specific ribonuclease Sa
MTRTTGFGKLERQLMSNDRLPAPARVALIELKSQIRHGKAHPAVFENREAGLPTLAAGQTYYEHQVGGARESTPGDPNARGSHRLVALVDAGNNVLKVFYTERHYAVGEWRELQYP